LNLTQVEWKGDMEKVNRFQVIVNSLVWDNGYTRAVTGPTRGDMLLDMHLLGPENTLISCNIFPGISDHNMV
jgi:hypothetical protein